MRKKYLICYLIYAVMWLFFHTLCVRLMDDVGPFAPFSFESLMSSWAGWSSRMICSAFGIIFMRRPMMLWGFADTAVILLVTVFLDKKFNKEKDLGNLMIIMGAVCIYPFSIMSTAGWMSTTLTYLWIVPPGLYVIFVIQKIGTGCHVSVLQYVSATFMFLLAIDIEVGVVMMFVILLGYSILQIWNKNKNKYVYILTMVSLMRIIFDVLWQGNMSRYQSDTTNYFPDHGMLSVLDKMILGFSTSVYTIYERYWVPLIILELILCLVVFENHKDRFRRTVCMISMVIAGIYPFSFFFAGQFSNLYTLISGYDARYGWISFYNYTKPDGYIMLFLWGTGLLCTIYMIFIIRNDIKNWFLWIVYLAAGFGSQFIMGFSPTVYLSASRTATWLFFAILICLIGIYMEWESKNPKSKHLIAYIVMSSGGISFINNLLFASNNR